MTITKTKLFEELRPFFHIEVYDKDGSTRTPRIRIEFRSMPAELKARALAFTMPCVACGEAIHPVRGRAAPKKRGTPDQNLYYAPSCTLAASIGCSRGGAARDEYALIKSIFRPDLA